MNRMFCIIETADDHWAMPALKKANRRRDLIAPSTAEAGEHYENPALLDPPSTAGADGSPTDGSPTDGSPTDGSPTDVSPTDGTPTDRSPTVCTLHSLY